MIGAGIDAGSRTLKGVLLDGQGRRVLASGMVDQGVRQGELAGKLFDRLLKTAGVSRRDVGVVVATGYGRDGVEAADTTITEITCHARGVRHGAPSVRTVIDMGGQDSKVIRLDADGRVRDFVMNDRCAAGTGRFLEVVAGRLGVTLDELGTKAAGAATPAPISNTCVVFAETEIIGLLAGGALPEDIAAGVQTSLASRVATLAGRTVAEPIVFTGGVARVSGMAAALEKALGRPMRVAADPQMTGALGAAILACEGM